MLFAVHSLAGGLIGDERAVTALMDILKGSEITGKVKNLAAKSLIEVSSAIKSGLLLGIAALAALIPEALAPIITILSDIKFLLQKLI